MIFKNKKYIVFVCLAILAVHGVLSACGYRPVDVATIFWYVMDPKFLQANFWQSVLYFHEIPPLLSIIHFAAFTLSGGHTNIFFEITLPLLHVASFLIFTKLTALFDFKYKQIITAILFLNPLLFIYFRFPFYSTFIFFQSLLILYVLFLSKAGNGFKLIAITSLLVLAALQRSSYHLVIIVVLLLPLLKNTLWKHRIVAFSLLLLPLSLYVKNYCLFGKFSSSTITGMYFHGHINKENNNTKIAKLGICLPANDYHDFVDENNPLVKKYAAIPILNQNDMNNIRYIQVADAFMNEFKENFSIAYSAKYVSLGFLRFFASPSADYNYTNTYFGAAPSFCYDIFDLPNYYFNNATHTCVPFSFYLIVYPCILCYLFWHFKKTPIEIRYILGFLLIFICVYFTIDPLESMRMRFEMEPFFYFMLFAVVNHIFAKKFYTTPNII